MRASRPSSTRVVGREVTLPGVLRPTTRSPVLIHHPSDAAWFSGRRVLPGLARITGRHSSSDGPGARAPRLTDEVAPGPGPARRPGHRQRRRGQPELAGQLLAAADLWVFVTTAARYADAVPWELLREASERGTAVAVVLDRVPPGPSTRSARTSPRCCASRASAGADLHGRRAELGPTGCCPPSVARLRGWLSALAGDAQARADRGRGRRCSGALDSLDARTPARRRGRRQEQTAAGALRRRSRRLRRGAGPRARRDAGRHAPARRGARAVAGVRRHGRVLPSGRVARSRGSGTGYVRPQGRAGAVPTTSGRRSSPASSRSSSTAPSWPRARSRGLARPARRRPAARRRTPTSRAPAPSRPAHPAARARLAGRHARDGPRRGQGPPHDRADHGLRRQRTRVVLMLVTFASTAGITGAEVGIAGGTAVVGQKLLEAMFGDQAVRSWPGRPASSCPTASTSCMPPSSPATKELSRHCRSTPTRPSAWHGRRSGEGAR